MIGRTKELKTLRDCISADRSRLVVVYGRRRVGKTFLVREAFDYRFTFTHTGLEDGDYAEQLNAPTDFGKNPPTGPSFIVNYFKNNPEALGVFDPGFKFDTKEDVDAAKTSIKEKMLAARGAAPRFFGGRCAVFRPVIPSNGLEPAKSMSEV